MLYTTLDVDSHHCRADDESFPQTHEQNSTIRRRTLPHDAAIGEITYTSCGHEPGLGRRASGAMEELGPTGPPLGIDQNASYSEGSITLSPGDTLLLYTDGLSEAGQSRRQLLGTSGLTRLLVSRPESADVQAEAEALVAQVSDFAGGVFRDDVAVLLARRG